VTVEVRRPGLAVRSRSGFSDLSHRTETAMKAESVLLFGGAQEDHRLLLKIGEPKQKGKIFEVPVTVGVPVEALALTPQEKGYLAEVPAAVLAEDQDGRRADLPGLHLKIVVAQPPPPKTYARFQTVVQLRDLNQRLIFTIQDPVSGHALWDEARIAQPKPAAK
jgi:hypothetical protein